MSYRELVLMIIIKISLCSCFKSLISPNISWSSWWMLQIFSLVSWLNDHMLYSGQSCCFYWITQYLLRPVSHLRTIFVSSGYHNAYRCCCWLHPWVSPHTAGAMSMLCLAVLFHWASKIAVRQCHHVFHFQLGATTDKTEFFMEPKLLNRPWRSEGREILSLSYVLFFYRGARTSLLLLNISRIILPYLIFCFPFLFSLFLFFLLLSFHSYFSSLFLLLFPSLPPSLPPSFLSSFSVCLLSLHVLFLRNWP